MGPIFNIFKCVNSTSTVHKQYFYNTLTVIFISYTVNSCDFTVHALKKKKKKPQNAETETCKMRNPIGYFILVLSWLIQNTDFN